MSPRGPAEGPVVPHDLQLPIVVRDRRRAASAPFHRVVPDRTRVRRFVTRVPPIRVITI